MDLIVCYQHGKVHVYIALCMQTKHSCYNKIHYSTFVPIGVSAIVLTPSNNNMYVTYVEDTGICNFTCTGSGTTVLWKVDGYDDRTPYVVNKGILVPPSITSPDGRSVTAKLMVPTTRSNSNTIVICVVGDLSSYILQSSDPVTLILQGTFA